MPEITFKTELHFPVEEVFAWHQRKWACNRLIPPFEKVKVLKHPQTIQNGARVHLRCDLSGSLNLNIPYFNWQLEHQDFALNKSFTDFQIKGPFKYYKHQHLFSEEKGKTIITDRIEYELPLSAISHLPFITENLFEKKIARTFAYRDSILKNDLEFHSQSSDKRKLRFLIAGASGMIGKALCAFLSTGGHSVCRVLRNKSELLEGDVFFDGEKIQISPEAEFDCVINLAGANIAGKSWSDSYKKELTDSRVKFTNILLQAIKSLNKKPERYISASGSGFYNNNGCQINDEKSPKGKGFLSDLCHLWEEKALEAKQLDMQVAILRLGVVIDPSGGALAKMLPSFLFCLGAKLGSGEQKFSWISLDDVLRSILFLSYQENLDGVFNLSSPNVISNSEMTRSLSVALKRPAFLKAPASVLKLFLGEMAEEALLSSVDSRPENLTAKGYKFLLPEFDKLLNHCLGLSDKEFSKN